MYLTKYAYETTKKNGLNLKAWHAQINHIRVDRILVYFEHEFREFC